MILAKWLSLLQLELQKKIKHTTFGDNEPLRPISLIDGNRKM